MFNCILLREFVVFYSFELNRKLTTCTERERAEAQIKASNISVMERTAQSFRDADQIAIFAVPINADLRNTVVSIAVAAGTFIVGKCLVVVQKVLEEWTLGVTFNPDD